MAPRLRSAAKPRRSTRDRKPIVRYSPALAPSEQEQAASRAVNAQRKKKSSRPKKVCVIFYSDRSQWTHRSPRTGRPFNDTALGKLPTELRIQILSNLLHVDYKLDFMHVPFEHGTVGLTHICRTLREEALHVLYGTNTFLVDPGEVTVSFARRFNPVDRYRVSLMKHIELILHAPQRHDWDVRKEVWLKPLLHIEDYGFRDLKSINVRLHGTWWYLWTLDPNWKEVMKSAVWDSPRDEFLIKTREALGACQIKAGKVSFTGIEVDDITTAWLRDSCKLSTE